MALTLSESENSKTNLITYGNFRLRVTRYQQRCLVVNLVHTWIKSRFHYQWGMGGGGGQGRWSGRVSVREIKWGSGLVVGQTSVKIRSGVSSQV